MRLALGTFVAACAVGLTATSAVAAGRSADEIYKDYMAVKTPDLDQTKIRDRAYVMKWQQENNAVMEKKGKFALEMFDAHPDDSRVAQMLQTRWTAMMSAPAKASEGLAEVKKMLPKIKDSKAKIEALYAKFVFTFIGARGNPTAALPDFEEFLAAAPKDQRSAQLLAIMAQVTTDETKSIAFTRRLVKDFPETTFAKQAEGTLKKLEAIGKPFELSFDEALTGKKISMKDLKGKVVVIDFWATWCGPCIAEIPNMKKIYAEYKDKGVEFIGVSLDQSKAQGGYDKLKNYVETNKIEWPQYYQGNYWDSEFSKSWGINSIPAVFLIDADGKIASINARGKLETLLPEYLAKAKKAKANP